MKVKIEINHDDGKEEYIKIRNIINVLEGLDTNQSKLETNNNTNSQDELSIVIRDKEKKTIDVKEELKRLGFTYYKYKKNSQKEDPRYTQTCTPSYWYSIKDQSVFDGLNIWTSEGGGSA